MRVMVPPGWFSTGGIWRVKSVSILNKLVRTETQEEEESGRVI